MIEVEVHQRLKAFLRAQGDEAWPHHLTAARLVARALRLQRDTLIRLDSGSAYRGQYRLSYLAALMLWPKAVIVVTPSWVQQALCHQELLRLKDFVQVNKPVMTAGNWPSNNFAGLLLLSPAEWLAHRQQLSETLAQVPVVIDGAENLETWTREHYTTQIQPVDWDQLLWSYPKLATDIRDVQAIVMRELFQHPQNPYECVMVEQRERSQLSRLLQHLLAADRDLCPPPWLRLSTALRDINMMLWALPNRELGTFSLRTAPIEVGGILSACWTDRTAILLSGVLDPDEPTGLRRLGLEDVTAVQFSMERHQEAIALYVPDRLPMPNTPEYAAALLHELRQFLACSYDVETFSVLIVDDLPLKGKIAAALAAEFGSRIKVESWEVGPGQVLITGWQFWLQHQRRLPVPQQLAIATLPFPSLEHPQVAARVAYYKRKRQDWFRVYLLPEALTTLQKAIAPVRQHSALVALLDSRVLHRSYGKQVLGVLSPYTRVNYLDESVVTLHPNFA